MNHSSCIYLSSHTFLRRYSNCARSASNTARVASARAVLIAIVVVVRPVSLQRPERKPSVANAGY